MFSCLLLLHLFFTTTITIISIFLKQIFNILTHLFYYFFTFHKNKKNCHETLLSLFYTFFQFLEAFKSEFESQGKF